MTEHHGDGCPGARVRIETTGVVEYQRRLTAKQYKYNKPGLQQDWNGAPSVTVLDPFGNQLTFIEAMQA